MKVLISNRRARYNYTINKTYEAGILLEGSEIKALRQGQGDLKDAFAAFHDHELFVINFNIPNYRFATMFQPDPQRSRKLLLHKKELRAIAQIVKTEKLLIIPLRIYLKHNVAKIELGLAKPRKLYDKRKAKQEAAIKRELLRANKGKY